MFSFSNVCWGTNVLLSAARACGTRGKPSRPHTFHRMARPCTQYVTFIRRYLTVSRRYPDVSSVVEPVCQSRCSATRGRRHHDINHAPPGRGRGQHPDSKVCCDLGCPIDRTLLPGSKSSHPERGIGRLACFNAARLAPIEGRNSVHFEFSCGCNRDASKCKRSVKRQGFLERHAGAGVQGTSAFRVHLAVCARRRGNACVHGELLITALCQARSFPPCLVRVDDSLRPLLCQAGMFRKCGF